MSVLMNIVDSDAVKAALEEFDRRPPKNQLQYGALQFAIWLRDSKPPPTNGWGSQRGNAAKLRELHEPIATLAARMITGEWHKSKGLSGWKEYAACLVATCAVTSSARSTLTCMEILQQARDENDDLQKRMYQRDHAEWLHLFESHMQGEWPEPTLKRQERRDVAAEAKWSAILDYLGTTQLWNTARDILTTLQLAVDKGEGQGDVIAMLKTVSLPPGHITREEHEEKERLLRAKQLADGDDFDDLSPVNEEEAGLSDDGCRVVSNPLNLSSKRKRADSDATSEDDMPPALNRRLANLLADDISNIQAEMEAAAVKAVKELSTETASGTDTSEEARYQKAKVRVIFAMSGALLAAGAQI